jgi:hypothetical protein
MALQAFVDDSGSEPQSPVFVLAGHISSTARWENFADEWREALAKPPGAAYFKAAEAMSLGGEFSMRKGWDSETRNQRVIELSEIVWKHATASISAQLMHRDWQDSYQLLAPIFSALPTKRFTHAYTFLWFTLLKELWLHPTKLTLDKAGPCDFVFDQQLGFEEESVAVWKEMKRIIDTPPTLPAHIRTWIGSPPIFRDEKCFVPLQAADLYAWSTRRAVAFAPDRLKLPQEAMELLIAMPTMHLNIERHHLLAGARAIYEEARRVLGGD